MNIEMKVTRFENEDVMTASIFFAGFGDNVAGNATINGMSLDAFQATYGNNHPYMLMFKDVPTFSHNVGYDKIKAADKELDPSYAQSLNGSWDYLFYNASKPSLGGYFYKKQQ